MELVVHRRLSLPERGVFPSSAVDVAKTTIVIHGALSYDVMLEIRTRARGHPPLMRQ